MVLFLSAINSATADTFRNCSWRFLDPCHRVTKYETKFGNYGHEVHLILSRHSIFSLGASKTAMTELILEPLLFEILGVVA